MSFKFPTYWPYLVHRCEYWVVQCFCVVQQVLCYRLCVVVACICNLFVCGTWCGRLRDQLCGKASYSEISRQSIGSTILQETISRLLTQEELLILEQHKVGNINFYTWNQCSVSHRIEWSKEIGLRCGKSENSLYSVLKFKFHEGQVRLYSIVRNVR